MLGHSLGYLTENLLGCVLDLEWLEIMWLDIKLLERMLLDTKSWEYLWLGCCLVIGKAER